MTSQFKWVKWKNTPYVDLQMATSARLLIDGFYPQEMFYFAIN